MRPETALLVCPFLLPEVRAVLRRLDAAVEVRPAPCAARCGIGLVPDPLPPGRTPSLTCAAAGALPEPEPWPTGGTPFHFLMDAVTVERLIDEGAYLVTPAWLASWPERLGREGLGEGQGEAEGTAAALFKETMRRVVLLDTGVGEPCGPALEAFARHVGLPAERIEVGLDQLALVVALAVERSRGRAAAGRAADLAALVETVSSLDAFMHEGAVVDRFARLAQVLFAPRRVCYLPVGCRGTVAPVRLGVGDAAPLEAELAALPPGAGVRRDGARILFGVGPPHDEVGRAALDGIAFPEHSERYEELIPALAHACYLAVRRARQLEALAEAAPAQPGGSRFTNG